MFMFHQNVTGKIGKILLFISIIYPSLSFCLLLEHDAPTI